MDDKAKDNDKKSKYISPLRTRDDLTYAEFGSWIRTTGFNKLATLAKNLDTSKAKNYPDKLRSVPTPWARLLLFESALYDKTHPAHDEIRDQWRGLLGVLGLADVLGLGKKLSVHSFDLVEEPPSDLKDAFIVLRPQHIGLQGKDNEDGKWDSFSVIEFDGKVLGATSPRTMVFTGVAHHCPSIIPFRSGNDRLTDPTNYFRQHSPEFLSVLQQWVEKLITDVKDDDDLARWLGHRPTDRTAQQVSRHEQLLEALDEWKKDIGDVSSRVTVLPANHSLLPAPYDLIKPVATAGTSADSDLFLRDHTDIIVGFRPKDNSFLVDAHGNEVTGQPIRVFGGFQIGSGKSLPDRFDFIPNSMKVIQNPAALFEDTLIEAQTFDSQTVICLSLANKTYLLPFRKEIVDYFTELELSELARNTQIIQKDSSTIRVEMSIPLVKRRSIRAYKDYHFDQNIITNENLDHPTQELAMWPDFICPGRDENGKPFFEHYFYYTSDVKRAGQVQVEFTPLGEIPLHREIPEKGMKWYVSSTPLQGFIGSVGDEHGMLLINHGRKAGQPTKLWKVGVDFGSTHTSVFYREVKQIGNEESDIEPVIIEPRVRILTSGFASRLQANFFFYKTEQNHGSSKDVALTTQLSRPVDKAEYFSDNWLPREGQIFLGSILEITPDNFETDLKWNIDRSNHTTSVFLRSLLIMIEAEAINKGARVVSVAHAYPSAFPEELREKHKDEWKAVETCVKLHVEPEPISEAVAVCRHLWKEQSGFPKKNVIAMDIGGSTTDIAIWANGALQIQESVKMAAGAASRNVKSDSASEFREWFIKTIKEGFSKDVNVFPSNFSSDRLDRRVYHAVLKSLSENNRQDSFISAIQAASGKAEVRSFLSPIVVIIAALSYFAGLLTRKKKISGSEQYYLFFCGKGGQLLRWIPGGKAKTMVQEMYVAGLQGPNHLPGTTQPTASVEISKYPKEEVGRGLLIERSLSVNNKDQGEGLFTEMHATVTVAEEGYPGLKWDENLNYEKLNRIKDNLPPVNKLTVLNHFVRVFSQSKLTKDIAVALGVEEIIAQIRYRDKLEQRISDIVDAGQQKALIEPLFILEAKVLVEMITGQSDLFD